MKIEVKCLNLTGLSSEDRQSINEVLMKSPNATIFHTVEWNEILIDEFGLQNVTLLATMDSQPVGLYSYYTLDGHICRCPETHLESVYGGPIATRDHDEVVVRLLKEAERLQKTALFHIWTPPSYDISPLVKVGYSSREMYTSILRLQNSEEGLWMDIKRKRRQSIKKAEKNNILAIEGNFSLVDEYYKVVVSTLTRAQKKILPKSFYRSVIERLGPKGMTKFMLAKYNGEFIAGVIALPYKDTLYGWHMGSYKEYWSIAPNDFLQWELIKWARRKGYEYYDFLRIDLPGISEWKKSYGGDTFPCYYLQKGTLGYQFWRVFRFMTSPRRIIGRLWRFAAGRGDTD